MSHTPEVLPIRTSDRILYELAPVDDGHAWQPVRRLGSRLTAAVSPLNYLDLRKVRRIEDSAEQADEALKLARVEVFHAGAPCGGPEVVPELHLYSLVARVVGLSSVGADPFSEAPVESLR
jgi:hypothetical protein